MFCRDCYVSVFFLPPPLNMHTLRCRLGHNSHGPSMALSKNMCASSSQSIKMHGELDRRKYRSWYCNVYMTFILLTLYNDDTYTKNTFD